MLGVGRLHLRHSGFARPKLQMRCDSPTRFMRRGDGFFEPSGAIDVGLALQLRRRRSCVQLHGLHAAPVKPHSVPRVPHRDAARAHALDRGPLASDNGCQQRGESDDEPDRTALPPGLRYGSRQRVWRACVLAVRGGDVSAQRHQLAGGDGEQQ